jgi:hypothetical protein
VTLLKDTDIRASITARKDTDVRAFITARRFASTNQRKMIVVLMVMMSRLQEGETEAVTV